MNFIRNYFQKRTNIMVANQDYELAQEFMNGFFIWIKSRW